MKTVWKYGLKGARSVFHRRPLVCDNRAILTINHGQDSNFNGTLACLDLSSGEELWRFDHNHNFTEPTLSDDGMLYAPSASGHIFKFDMNGKICWQTRYSDRNLWAGKLLGDYFVYAEVAAKSKTTRALDKETGELKWSYVNGGHSYGLARNTSDHVVLSSYIKPDWDTSIFALDRVDLLSGKRLWRYEHKDILYRSVIFEDHVFVGSRDHVAIFELMSGRLIDRFSEKEIGEFFQQPIIINDAVVFISKTGKVIAIQLEEQKKGLLRVKRKKVKIKWQTQLGGGCRANILFQENAIHAITEDKFYNCIDAETGTQTQKTKIPNFKEAHGFSLTDDGLLLAVSRDASHVALPMRF